MSTIDNPHTISGLPRKSSDCGNLLAGGLLRRRICLLPTWRGWALLLAFACVIILGLGPRLCDFLTVNDPITGGVLVVEGWVPPYAGQEAIDEFRRHDYLGIYVTGEPIEEGSPYIGFVNLADFTVAVLKQMGAPAASLHAVPGPYTGKDRTYSMACTLKKRLEADGISTAKINVVSFGPHSRRSRLLYEFAFGPDSKIGMIAVTDRNFDPKHWWKTSAGVRSVISEAIAYGYARLIFRPPQN